MPEADVPKADVTRPRGRRIEVRTGSFGTGYDTSLHTRGEDGGNGSGLAEVAIAGSCHGGPIGEDDLGSAFQDARDHGRACERDSQRATSLTARLVPVYLRLAIGIPELASSLEKLQDFQAFVALWHKFHLPAAEILAPAFVAAELLGALLLLAGWQTRTVAALFVAELLSEILLTKQPLVRLAGWMLEWQSLCVVLILARIGAGPWSLDWRSARRRGARLSGETLTSGGLGT